LDSFWVGCTSRHDDCAARCGSDQRLKKHSYAHTWSAPVIASAVGTSNSGMRSVLSQAATCTGMSLGVRVTEP
jgi:hypothetical protein